MLCAIVLYAGLAAVSSAAPGPSSEDIAAYERAKTSVGRDANAQVKLALWCQAHGLEAERIKHLALAVLVDPTHAAARGLMGLVAYRGHWQRPAAVAEKVKADEALAAAMAEYNGRRERTPNTSDAQWKLALWCEEKGLKGEAQAHFATVVRLDPTREAAWKRLGCKKENGRWVSEAQLAAEKAEAEAQKQADHHWKPLLTKWRSWLGDKARQAEADQGLGQVTDPRAVPAVWTLFGKGDAAHQAVAVQVFGQIDAAGASRGLAMLALSGKSPEVRRRATQILKRRDPRESAGLLIALLRDPIKYEVRPVNGPGSAGVLFVEGKRFNVQRLYNAPAAPQTQEELGVIESFYESVWAKWNVEQISAGFNNPSQMTSQQLAHRVADNPSAAPGLITRSNPIANGTIRPPSSFGEILQESLRNKPGKSQMINEYNYNLTEAQNAAIAAQQQLATDVSAIERYNQTVVPTNERAQSLLKETSGQDLGQDNDSWKTWWTDQLGYAYQSSQQTTTPTYTEVAVTPYTPDFVPPRVYVSCFGAGTLVRTLRGAEAIETLRVGDMVLTQGLKTGALGYKPVLVIHHNPPSPKTSVIYY